MLCVFGRPRVLRSACSLRLKAGILARGVLSVVQVPYVNLNEEA